MKRYILAPGKGYGSVIVVGLHGNQLADSSRYVAASLSPETTDEPVNHLAHGHEMAQIDTEGWYLGKAPEDTICGRDRTMRPLMELSMALTLVETVARCGDPLPLPPKRDGEADAARQGAPMEKAGLAECRLT
jgi:hypothetical protein